MSCTPLTIMATKLRHLLLFGAALLGCFISMREATAQGPVTTLTVNKCLSGKIKSVGASMVVRAGCFSKEARTGIADPICHQKASDKFTGGSDPAKGAFAKLETKYPTPQAQRRVPCLTFNDSTDVETAVTDYAASLPVVAGAFGICDATKIKCLGKYVAAISTCASKAAGKSGTIDATCAEQAISKLANGKTGCLDKAILKRRALCTHSDSQAAALQGAADQFLRVTLCALDSGALLCPTPTPTPGTLPSATAPTAATSTATVTPTTTLTTTATTTPTTTPTDAPTATATNTPIATPTATLTPTVTATLLATDTSTPTPVPTCTPHSSGTYIENCDGTVTSTQTGLQWEQKTGAVGAFVDCSTTACPNPHDVNSTYQWCLDANHNSLCDSGANQPDGGAFTDFLAALNGGSGFAGHKDWRLPTSFEVLTIRGMPVCPGFQTPCINPIFGPTHASLYWTFTTNNADPASASVVYTPDWFLFDQLKGNAYSVRAVRSGPIPTATSTVMATPTLTPTATPTPCTPHSSGTYNDNCDGTVVDSATGLQWEKKTTSIGSGANLNDPHDVDNHYSWSAVHTAADGTAFTQFLAALNTPPCFAGHCDWRLPRVNRDGEAAELETILLAPYPCETSPCIDPIFGPTMDFYYWSSTTDAALPSNAWYVLFNNGYVFSGVKNSQSYVRAVRAGFPPIATPTQPAATNTPTPIRTVTPTPTPTSTPSRYIDNGNGTVTDTQTGLQWEKKTNTGGGGANLADPHDVDNSYTWSAGSSLRDGTAFTQFLAVLNFPPCFAGHCDWRLPTSLELQTLLLEPYPCSTLPCIDPIFGPTVSFYYWSDTTLGASPSNALVVYFGNGLNYYDLKNHPNNVRAVRTGP